MSLLRALLSDIEAGRIDVFVVYKAELRKFRDTSRCSACVHYSGRQLWLALLLMNDELRAPGLDIIVQSLPDVLPLVG